MNENVPMAQTQPNISVETTTEVTDYGSQIPDYAIRRFAKFLLPKMQKALEKKKPEEAESST